MLYFSVLWSFLSQCNYRFNGNQSLPQATPSSHMPFLLQLLMTNLYKHNLNDVWKNHKISKREKTSVWSFYVMKWDFVGKNDLSLLTSIMLVLVLLVFTRLQLFRLPQSDTKVKGKLFITRYKINLFFLIFLIELYSSKCNISGCFCKLEVEPKLASTQIGKSVKRRQKNNYDTYLDR